MKELDYTPYFITLDGILNEIDDLNKIRTLSLNNKNYFDNLIFKK